MNTATMKKQLGCIQVQVPPDIDDDQSTGSDVTANEGDNVTLTCVARGKPTPRIVWRREDGQKIIVPSTSSSSSSSYHQVTGANNNNNNKAMKSLLIANSSSSTASHSQQQQQHRERMKG